MGISIAFKDISAALMEVAHKNGGESGAKPVVFHEPKSQGQYASHTIENCSLFIVDFMLAVYSMWQPVDMRGRDLIAHIFTTLVHPALLRKQTLFLVFDNPKKVPPCKAATQMKRRRTMMAVPEDLPISDDAILRSDDRYKLLATSKVRARLMEYILHGLMRAIHDFTSGAEDQYGVVYASTPWRAAPSFGDPRLTSGGFLELTRTGAPCPRPTSQGEGDPICRVLADKMAQFMEVEGPVVVDSKDLDMLGIFSASPPKNSVFLRISVRDGASGGREFVFIDVDALWESVFRMSSARALHFTLALILAGSDFCEGVRGIAGLRILRTALGLRPAREPHKRSAPARPDFFEPGQLMVQRDGPRLSIAMGNLMRILVNASTRRTVDQKQPNMLKRAVWNLRYWLDLDTIPSPLETRAWWKNDKGVFLPVLDKVGGIEKKKS